MAAVQIYDLASRVHQPEGQRLEIGPAADDVILLVLCHVQDLAAEAMALSVHFVMICQWFLNNFRTLLFGMDLS